MQRSLAPAGVPATVPAAAPAATRLTGRQIDGAPVYEYVRAPGVPPLSVLRFSTGQLPVAGSGGDHAHAHDFLVLAYFERGAGSFRLGRREWPLHPGDAFVIAPGEVVRLGGRGHGGGRSHGGDDSPGGVHGHGTDAEGWCVFFPPGIIASEAPGALGGSLGWKTHPLLSGFAGRGAGGAQRLPVPASERTVWAQHVTAIERELHEPREGAAEAALAHLTLLLVSAARISVDIGQDFRLRDEPLLAAVFEFIEEHYHEPVSLAAIASEVGLTPGHLTTVVRRKTGRSAHRWITERRMAEARKLLRETDLTVETVAARVGYRQPSFFIKHFRRDHTVTPAAWRHRTRAAAARG